MGQTKKAIKEELKAVYNSVLSELTDHESRLTHDEKIVLRDYILMLNEGTCHTFSHIFIKKKIKQIIRARNGGNVTSPERLDRLQWSV